MLRGIDAATSGMIALERKQNVLTNNLANADTPGYKQDISPLRSFPEFLIERIRDKDPKNPTSNPLLGSISMGVYNQETLPAFSQGILQNTNMPFDVAIEDQGLPTIQIEGKYIKSKSFFAVQTKDGGLQLTRNGNFGVNENGQLTTATGELVLGRNGNPISHPALTSGDVEIRDNGDVIVFPGDPIRAEMVAGLGIVIVDNPNALIKQGDGLFQLEGASVELIHSTHPHGVNVHHKMLEQSNVDLSQTMTEMMSNIRLYEANQKVLQAYDKTLEQLNTIGKV